MAAIRNILTKLRGASGISRPGDEPLEPIEVDGLVVRCFAQLPQKGAPVAPWGRLLEKVPDASPFLDINWQWAARVTDGAMPPRIIVVQRGDDAIAVFPMCLNKSSGLQSIAPAISDYLDPLIATGEEENALRALLAFLSAMWDRKLAEVALHNIREGGPCHSMLPQLAEVFGFASRASVVEQTPIITLPKSWDEYLSGLDAHERKELKRKVKKAETSGAAELAVAEGVGHAVNLLGQSVGEKSKAVRKYLWPMLLGAGFDVITARRMEVLELTIQGKAACSLVQFVHPLGPMLYNLGWDPAMKEWSPGIVAVGMAIRRAIEQGFGTYDLLRGREDYKYRLGAKDRPLYKVTLKKKDG